MQDEAGLLKTRGSREPAKRRKREALVPVETQVRAGRIPMIEDDPPNAVSEGWRAKIDQQSEMQVHQAEIGQGLLPVNGKQGFERLQFYQKSALHEEIGPKGNIERAVSHDHGDGDLTLHLETPLREEVR